MKLSVFPFLFLTLIFQSCSFSGYEFHVSPNGNDTNTGTEQEPIKTITAASRLAQPGDVITVHEGIYRERINPPRGGDSDQNRITYQAADGEKVVIKGSELVKDWELVNDDTWKAIIPNSFFGEFNPYLDLINGDWFNPKGRAHHTGAVYLDGHWLTEAATFDLVLDAADQTPLWFAQVDSTDDGNTSIWAQFKGVNPNEELVEINVRQSVFYPKETGINYLTVKGFTMEHAATPWSPPTAEQIGLIGTHWSKGWIIEDNTIQYSTCVGITLGKHGDEFDNTSANSAEGYVKTIERGTANGWTKENIGHHIIRNNKISHCEQAGIVGSLGPIFCQIYENEIHDIHIRRLFTGAEMAGIKLHGAIDTEIWGNHIYRTCRGIWLDWMAQGTRVSQNLLHDNGPYEDLFLEVNHGPALVDNNLLLSHKSILVNSQGEAFVHNLIAGQIRVLSGERRLTPYLKNHSTEVAGLAPNKSGDERYYNNILVGAANLGEYDKTVLTNWMDGNVFLNGAKPSEAEPYPLLLPDFDPEISIVEKKDGWYLEMKIDNEWASIQEKIIITTDMLEATEVPNLPFVMPDGSSYNIDIDYFGKKRNSKNQFPGSFVMGEDGTLVIKVW
ncbi:MAG: right-handed parallel beta-helix repeat-containing protein [Bacteroidales bacterium]|nr:right-handed parallel beta-helix repeat-containing protein [Bacteroidales bacterium]